MSSKWQLFFYFKIRLFQWKVKNFAYREFTVDSGWDSSSAIVCKHELEICNLLIKQCRYYTLGWQVDSCEDSSCIMEYFVVIDNHLYFDTNIKIIWNICFEMDWLDRLGAAENLKNVKNFEKYASKKNSFCVGYQELKKIHQFC